MPRIRTIKPDHWEDEIWNTVSLEAHLLHIGMKNFCDDAGVIRDNAVFIKNKVFPTREDIKTTSVVAWLFEMVKAKIIISFNHDGKGFYLLDFVSEKIDKPQPPIVPLSVINTVREQSRIIENNPAGEESIGEVEERKVWERDTIFEDAILQFFGFNEIANFDKLKKISECCCAVFFAGNYDYFKEQFYSYVEVKKLQGLQYKNKFLDYLGTTDARYQDGIWNSENWNLRHAELLQGKNGISKMDQLKNAFQNTEFIPRERV